MKKFISLTVMIETIIGILIGIYCKKWEAVVICIIVLLSTLASCKE